MEEKIIPVLISESDKKRLDKIKIHPRETYKEVVNKILNERQKDGKK